MPASSPVRSRRGCHGARRANARGAMGMASPPGPGAPARRRRVYRQRSRVLSATRTASPTTRSGQAENSTGWSNDSACGGSDSTTSATAGRRWRNQGGRSPEGRSGAPRPRERRRDAEHLQPHGPGPPSRCGREGRLARVRQLDDNPRSTSRGRWEGLEQRVDDDQRVHSPQRFLGFDLLERNDVPHRLHDGVIRNECLTFNDDRDRAA
jgi:hypothetical protein